MREARITLLGFAVVLALGLAFLVLEGLVRETERVQTLGVYPVYPVAPIKPGQEACQNDVGLADPLHRVRFNVGTFGKPGTPLTVTIRNRSGGVLGGGKVAPGWKDDGTPKNVPVGDIESGQIVSVCVRNDGRIRSYVYGDIYAGKFGTGPIGVRPTVSPSSATVDGVPIPGDLSLDFVRAEPRSLLARIPSAFVHASRFRPGFVGAWTYWVLLAAALVGAPLLLWRALAAARCDSST